MIGHSATENNYILENTFTHERFEYTTNDTLIPNDTVLVRLKVDCSMLNYSQK